MGHSTLCSYLRASRTLDFGQEKIRSGDLRGWLPTARFSLLLLSVLPGWSPLSGAPNLYPCFSCHYLLEVTAMFPAAFCYHVPHQSLKLHFLLPVCKLLHSPGTLPKKAVKLVWLNLTLAGSEWLLLITSLLMRWLQIEYLNSCFIIFPHLSHSSSVLFACSSYKLCRSGTSFWYFTHLIVNACELL